MKSYKKYFEQNNESEFYLKVIIELFDTFYELIPLHDYTYEEYEEYEKDGFDPEEYDYYKKMALESIDFSYYIEHKELVVDSKYGSFVVSYLRDVDKMSKKEIELIAVASINLEFYIIENDKHHNKQVRDFNI